MRHPRQVFAYSNPASTCDAKSSHIKPRLSSDDILGISVPFSPPGAAVHGQRMDPIALRAAGSHSAPVSRTTASLTGRISQCTPHSLASSISHSSSRISLPLTVGDNTSSMVVQLAAAAAGRSGRATLGTSPFTAPATIVTPQSGPKALRRVSSSNGYWRES